MIFQPHQIEWDKIEAEERRERNWSSPSARRCLQIQRCLITIEVLRGRRYPMRLEDINREIVERTAEDWHERTTRRDLGMLEQIGVVEIVEESRPQLYRLAPSPEEVVAAAMLARRTC